MCTLTWWRDQHTYGVFFNRDEKKDRPVAEPPRVLKAKGGKFLAPRDPQGGGTWMLVTNSGLVLCLLNKWHLGGGGSLSRGQLVLGLADVRGLKTISSRLVNLGDYSPFSLFAMDGSEEKIWEWDGEQLSEIPTVMPLTSSSYSFEEVKAARFQKFSEGFRGEGYHSSQDQEASAFTVRMCRPDAQTWSRSKVTVGEEIVWDYLAEQPNLKGKPERSIVKLARC